MGDNDFWIYKEQGRVVTREETERKFEERFGGYNSKIKINHDDNFKVEFKRGYLHIIGENEEVCDGPSMLYFGKTIDPLNDGIIHCVKLAKLKKLVNSGFPFVYHAIRSHMPSIKVRESIWGELEVKLVREESGVELKSKVLFSRKEYNIIRDYVMAIKDNQDEDKPKKNIFDMMNPSPLNP